jgi:cysteine synthase A
MMTDASEIKTLKATTSWGRGKVYADITETIGHTPLVRVGRMAKQAGAKADVLVKLEFFNPLSSVKDRIGVAMIDVLEAEGKIEPGKTVLVEPTSGNTGIGLAFVAAARGYKLMLVMPESMSIERRKILAHLGAELVLTPAAGGMPGAIDKANQILAATPGAVQPSQFENPANPLVHEKTTADLERHAGQRRRARHRRRHGWHAHGLRSRAQGAQAVGQDHCGRARGQPDPFGRCARTA